MRERIVFHYNKAHNSDASIPPWVIKSRGATHYVHHLDARVGFSTRETPDNPHTRGSLIFRGVLTLREENGQTIATIEGETPPCPSST